METKEAMIFNSVLYFKTATESEGIKNNDVVI